MAERLTPERSVRLLRAKAGELESMVPSYLDEIGMVHPNHFAQDIRKLYEMAGNTLADIALIATLLADHIEDLISDGDLPIDDANVRDMREDRTNARHGWIPPKDSDE